MRNIQHVDEQRLRLTASLVGLFTGLVLCSILFVAIAEQVRELDTLGFDEAVLQAIYGMSNRFLDVFMPVATELGGVLGVSVISAIAVSILIYTHKKPRALMLAICVAGAAGINLVLKAMFERTRPDLWETLIIEHGFSFPSGHAMASAALGMALVVVAWESRWRRWVLAASISYILFVGFSRLYLGVHYPTDVIAGWMVSGAWVMAVTLLLRSRLGNRVLRKLQ